MITQKELEEANADRLICKANLATWRKNLKKAVAIFPCLEEHAQAECLALIGEAYLRVKAEGANFKAAQEVYRQALFLRRNARPDDAPTEHDSPARLEQINELPSDDYSN
jgi:hypothetical protein